jgi:tRNA A-37 threonylcarbamoyl transferase component Bud32
MGPQPPATAAPTGRRFELIERIGAGAFGEVFLANQVSGADFSRTVAVKLLHPDRFDEDDAARRIRDEARVLGRLHHPHIVTVMDLVRLETQWAVVMEHVEGADLETVLQALRKAGRVFPAAAALEAVAQIADALDAAYNAEGPEGLPLRVVHRDVKPANLRLTPNGAVKVLDFGIARARMPSREASTGAYVIGTQRYMAPERIAGRGEGPEGDVYSLAATAFELIVGEPLGRSPVLSDRHEPWVRDRLRALDAVLPGPEAVRARVAGLLLSCLAGEALDRPRAADLAEQAGALARQMPGEDLRAFSRRFVPQVPALLGRVPDRVHRVLTEGSTGRVDLAEPGTLRQARAEPDTRELRRPSLVLPALLAAVVVVVVGAGGLLMGVAGGVGAWWALASAPPVADAAVVAPAPPPPAPAVVEPTEAPELAFELDSGSGPTEVAPAPRPRAVVAPRSAPDRVEPVEPVEPVAPAPVLSRAQVVVSGASGITVTCGAVRAVGTTSARIMSFPAGSCAVDAVVGGRELRGVADIVAPRTVTCAAGESALSCD